MRNQPVPPPGGPQSAEDRHEMDVEEREAYQYWGYLFRSDKTGTDKLKSLLRGLKELINQNYEPSDNPDLTPTQLAYFYRGLHGNYDQLFLGTPSDSIAFIYKSLGCLHSLQPLPQSTAFVEPTVPALKTEGWIMWQTIQLLLGPEEHSSFLRESLQRWDVKDPTTGETFPNLLPRSCFPMEPDKHMVAWYEGVSERLRKEAEEEERQREIEAEQAEVRRIQYRRNREDHPEDTESVDSRGPAMAYFRNPLYRQDGRPTIVRRNSKRPQLSPRRSSMKDKAKEGATTMGHVIRNIGSPHLWDGRAGSKSQSRERSKDRRRRFSLPDNNRHHNTGDRRPSSGYDAVRVPSHSSSHHHRSRSGQQPEIEPSGEPNASGGATPTPSDPRNQTNATANGQDATDPALRHSRSHEPTPSQKEYTDYFQPHPNPNDDDDDDDEEEEEEEEEEEGEEDNDPNSTLSASVTPNNIGPSFEPSASPLFASHIAKQPQPSHRPSVDYRTTQDLRRPPPASHHNNPPPSRQYSRSPPDSSSLRPRDRRYPSRDRSRGGGGGGGGERRRSASSRAYHEARSPPRSHPGGRYAQGQTDTNRRPSDTPPYPSGDGPPRFAPSPDRDRRRSARMSGSDLPAADVSPRRNGPSGVQKQTRFAQGVDGRRYPNESAWRS